jgi:hypothetical protein
MADRCDSLLLTALHHQLQQAGKQGAACRDTKLTWYCVSTRLHATPADVRMGSASCVQVRRAWRFPPKGFTNTSSRCGLQYNKTQNACRAR